MRGGDGVNFVGYPLKIHAKGQSIAIEIAILTLYVLHLSVMSVLNC